MELCWRRQPHKRVESTHGVEVGLRGCHVVERDNRVRHVTGGARPYVSEVIKFWSELQVHKPADQAGSAAEYLSRVTGVALGRVHHLRRVRNACAHPAERGRPSSDDISRALITAK